MALTLTIGGLDKESRYGTINLTRPANGRATLSFEIISDGTYRPGLDDIVVLSVDGDAVFGGLVERVTERGFIGTAGTDEIVLQVSAGDYNVYPERRYFNGPLPAGTLKSQLQVIDDYLSTYGVTLHAGQVNGPSMPDLSYDYRRLDEVLNELATITADAGDPFVWNIDADKFLRMYQPSTTSAPFDIVVPDDCGNVLGDLEVEETRSDYANRIILKALPKTEIEREETFIYGTDPYPYDPVYDPFHTWGYITHETIFETLRIPPDPDAASWTWDPSTGLLTRDAGTPTTGQVTIFKFDGTFAGTWIAEDAAEIAAHGLWERVIVVESIPSDTTGQALVDAYLAKSLPPTRTITYRTREPGLEVGQSQTVTVPRRDLDVTAIITEINSTDVTCLLEHTVTAIVDTARTNLERGWRDVYKIWAGDKSGGAATQTVTGGTGTGTSVGPGGPDLSVQYNDAGVFGGDAEFTYNPNTNSVVMGALSSITAEFPESCGIFGYDCHIEDP